MRWKGGRRAERRRPLILGQVKARTQQLQRDTEAARRLAEEEQALTKAWQETSPLCTSRGILRKR